MGNPVVAHFAEVDETNTVFRVLVVHNDITTIDGVEVEQRGIDFLTGLYPDSGTWVQTSYNANQRVYYAGVGFTWDADSDAFYPAQPYPSWTLDDEFVWVPPVDHPDDGDVYLWEEASLSWIPAD
jgi:hypothetical protein